VALPSKVVLALVSAGSLAAVPRISVAQHITVDGRFSSAQTLVGPNYSIDANLGKQVGSNLFHSFGQFGLATGESAAFSGPATISNVIGRVTGGNPSSIDGKIQSNIAGANLYLINPSGIVFGPNATVNVSGGFHASTADYVKMSDGAKFQATNPDSSTLSAAPPAAFGFLTARPAAITVNGSTLGPVPGTLGLVAGPVSITGATLSAPAGTIHVTSVAGTGEVPVDPRNTAASTVTSFGPVAVTGGSTLDVSDPTNLGSGGSVFIRAGSLSIDASEVNADNYGSGSGAVLSLRGDNQITLSNGANVHAVAMGSGNGADVLLSTATSGVILADAATVLTDTMGSGNSGSITIIAGQLTLQNGTNVLAQNSGSGSGGDVTVSAGGSLTLNSGASLGTVGFADGNAGNVSVTAAGPITIDMSVGAAASLFQGIASQTLGTGRAGNTTVTAGTISITSNGEIESATSAFGQAGDVSVTAFDKLTIDGSGGTPAASPTGIFSVAAPGSTGASGSVSVSAGNLSIRNSGEIATSTFASGSAGSTTVAVSGRLTIDGSKADPKTGVTGILSQAEPGSSGAAGIVNVRAENLSIINSGEISATTFVSRDAGSVTVAISAQLTIDGSGENLAIGHTGIFSQTKSGGPAGTVSVSAGNIVITNDGVISSTTLGPGNGGSVSVAGGSLTIVGDGRIATDTLGAGSGNAGSVSVDVAGRLAIDGMSQTSFTGISSRSTQGSNGNAGDVKVGVGGLSIVNGGAISTTTDGSGAGGTVAVAVGGDIALSSGGQITSATGGAGNGGITGVVAQGPLSVTDPGSGIIASATSTASGNAGSVIVAAPQITIAKGGEIASTTAGTGAGGSVIVTVPGALVLDGAGVANTQIAASATGPQSGPGGSVSVTANGLIIEGGAQIASSTAGPGKGGDVNVAVASDIVLPDPGPQITARSTGSGDAGSITVSATRLLMNNGAAISTEAETSTASGGNITLHVRDFLYLVSSEISTSVKGETGNGGNIVVDPQLVILDHSSIIAQAIEGHGGNITITAGQFIPSSDSIVSASSELGISGTIVINGPRVDVNGALVVLSTQLRGRTEVLREACAARADRPISSLVEAGRGALPQDPEATLPALYVAGRDLARSGQTAVEPTEASSALKTMVRLAIRCG
jgi:filamentous hemagglutinin family protein